MSVCYDTGCNAHCAGCYAAVQQGNDMTSQATDGCTNCPHKTYWGEDSGYVICHPFLFFILSIYCLKIHLISGICFITNSCSSRRRVKVVWMCVCVWCDENMIICRSL